MQQRKKGDYAIDLKLGQICQTIKFIRINVIKSSCFRVIRVRVTTINDRDMERRLLLERFCQSNVTVKILWHNNDGNLFKIAKNQRIQWIWVFSYLKIYEQMMLKSSNATWKIWDGCNFSILLRWFETFRTGKMLLLSWIEWKKNEDEVERKL